MNDFQERLASRQHDGCNDGVTIDGTRARIATTATWMLRGTCHSAPVV